MRPACSCNLPQARGSRYLVRTTATALLTNRNCAWLRHAHLHSITDLLDVCCLLLELRRQNVHCFLLLRERRFKLANLRLEVLSLPRAGGSVGGGQRLETDRRALHLLLVLIRAGSN